MTEKGRFGLFLSSLFTPQQKPDWPVPVGYKIGWITVKSTSSDKVASLARIRSPRSANWQKGIGAAYNKGLAFVAPPISGWVCIIGGSTMPNDNSSLDTVSRDVANLSSAFGEAQAFATHRVIEYHHWMLAKSGHLIRCFAYIGETGRLLANTGTLTDAESKIKLFKLPQERWQPNESDVMAVAADWSFDPMQLTSKSAPAALGVLGKL